MVGEVDEYAVRTTAESRVSSTQAVIRTGSTNDATNHTTNAEQPAVVGVILGRSQQFTCP